MDLQYAMTLARQAEQAYRDDAFRIQNAQDVRQVAMLAQCHHGQQWVKATNPQGIASAKHFRSERAQARMKELYAKNPGEKNARLCMDLCRGWAPMLVRFFEQELMALRQKAQA